MKKFITLLSCVVLSTVSINTFAGDNALKIRTIKQLYKNNVRVDADGMKWATDDLTGYADDGLLHAIKVANAFDNSHRGEYESCLAVNGSLPVWSSQDPIINLSAMKYLITNKGRVKVKLPYPANVEYALSCGKNSCRISDVFQDNISLIESIFKGCKEPY